jgi:hypothetical protein
MAVISVTNFRPGQVTHPGAGAARDSSRKHAVHRLEMANKSVVGH